MGQSSIIYKSSSLGVDGCKEGWVGVAIDECGQVLGSHVSSTFKNLLSYFSGIKLYFYSYKSIFKFQININNSVC